MLSDDDDDGDENKLPAVSIIDSRTMSSSKKSLDRIDMTNLLSDLWLLYCFIIQLFSLIVSVCEQLLPVLRSYYVYVTYLWQNESASVKEWLQYLLGPRKDRGWKPGSAICLEYVC